MKTTFSVVPIAIFSECSCSSLFIPFPLSLFSWGNKNKQGLVCYYTLSQLINRHTFLWQLLQDNSNLFSVFIWLNIGRVSVPVFSFLWVEPLGFVRLLRWVIISNRSGQTPDTPNIQSIINAVRVDCHSGYDGEFFLTLHYFTLVHPCLHQSWSVSRFTRHGLYSLGKVGGSFCLYV